jgi:hypothetical protein
MEGLQMIRLLRIILMAVAASACINSAAIADAYYDQASWDAATEGQTIGPYTGGITETIYTETISTELEPDCPSASNFCVIAQGSTTTQLTGLSNILINFMFPTFAFDYTGPTKVVFSFDSPILGLAATDTGNILESDLVTTNGFFLPGNPPHNEFFGLTGIGSTLTFESRCCTDNPALVNLQDILVTTVPEPPTWGPLLVGGAISAVVLRRRRKKIGAGSMRANKV